MSSVPAAPCLEFRWWREQDLPLATALWCDPEVMAYLGGPRSPEEAKQRLHLEIQNAQRLGFQYWPIFERSSGEFAGCAGLKPYHDEPGVLEIGAHIMRRFWSYGFGEEAATAVVHFAFDELKVNGLAAGHHPANIHSKALLDKLGFKFSHPEIWGPLQMQHLFYRLLR